MQRNFSNKKVAELKRRRKKIKIPGYIAISNQEILYASISCCEIQSL